MNRLILMKKKLPENTKGSTLRLFELLQKENVEYVYRGDFDSKITDGILSLAEINLDDQKNSLKIRKRVFFILVEGLQNITRHQDISNTENEYNEGFLVLQKKENAFKITTGNLIKNETIPYLKNILKKINSLSASELKEYYRKILNNHSFSEKGGAGLGLIEIARKSGNKISFDFQEISDTHSYFYMQTAISYSKDNEKISSSLERMKKIHEYFIANDIILDVTGIFNHDKLVYLISILESQFSKQIVLKNKLFSIMIELMQNVVKHADEIELNNVKGKYSIFLISNNNEEISVISGNYIQNNKAIELEKHLKEINKMNHNELNKFHFNTLFNYKTKKRNKFGLGLLDIRIKCKSKLDYTILKINETFSFFSIKVNLNKEIKRKNILTIDDGKTTPYVLLDEKNGKFIICGDSFPLKAEKFYKPIISWLKEYQKNPRIFSHFEFKFRYLSTSSQKELIKIFNILEKIAEKSAVIVKWYYKNNDEDALNFAIEFSKLFKLDFNMEEYNELECNDK